MARKYQPWFIIGGNGGQVPLKRQLLGLQNIAVEGRTVLDVGCAEGLISFHLAGRGATKVHGVELRERAVEVAQSIAGYTGQSDRVRFWHGDLRDTDAALTQDGMEERYDVVLAMASIQKLGKQAVPALLRLAAACAGTFVIRLPEPTIPDGWRKTRPVAEVLAGEGFEQLWESCGHPQGDPPWPLTGGSWLSEFARKDG